MRQTRQRLRRRSLRARCTTLNTENSCAMLKEDKSTKDRQNRRQEREEIQIAEDRYNHLAKVKGKLEQSLDGMRPRTLWRGKGSPRELWRGSKGCWMET